MTKVIVVQEIDLDNGNTERCLNTDEIFKKITSIPKWYAGKFSPQIASRIKRHYRKGIYRQDSLVRLFDKFGYEQNEVTWKKSEKS